MECDAIYIGETLQNLEERLREHQGHVEKKDLKGSAIAEHVMKIHENRSHICLGQSASDRLRTAVGRQEDKGLFTH